MSIRHDAGIHVGLFIQVYRGFANMAAELPAFGKFSGTGLLTTPGKDSERKARSSMLDLSKDAEPDEHAMLNGPVGFCGNRCARCVLESDTKSS